MRLEKATPTVVHSVAYRMRDMDLAELSALSWQDTRQGLANELAMKYAGFEVMAVHDPDPIAILGWLPVRPNALGLLMFATDDFPASGKSFSRFAHQHVQPIIRAHEPNRVEAQSLDLHTDAHQWLEFLGLQRECVLPKWGRSGETFIQFAWTAD